MSLVFEVVFSVAVISRIEAMGVGEWQAGSRRRAKVNIQTQTVVLCHL